MLPAGGPWPPPRPCPSVSATAPRSTTAISVSVLVIRFSESPRGTSGRLQRINGRGRRECTHIRAALRHGRRWSPFVITRCRTRPRTPRRPASRNQRLEQNCRALAKSDPDTDDRRMWGNLQAATPQFLKRCTAPRKSSAARWGRRRAAVTADQRLAKTPRKSQPLPIWTAWTGQFAEPSSTPPCL
jgi:hypothetical protein